MTEVFKSKKDFGAFELNRNNNKALKKLKISMILAILCSIPMVAMVVITGVKSCCIPFASSDKSNVAIFIENLRYKITFLKDWRLQLPLAVLVQFIAGSVIYKNLKSRVIHKDLLVVLGTAILFLYNLYQCFFGFEDTAGMKVVHFEIPIFITTITLFGKYIEEIIKSSKKYSEIFDRYVKDGDTNEESKWINGKVYLASIITVIIMAAITFIIWFFYIFSSMFYFIEKPIIYAASVLVTACPWTLGGVLKESSIENKKILKIIRQNYVLGAVASIFGIYFAATGQLNIILAAVFNAVASVLMQLNLLRVNWKDINVGRGNKS